ncbi:glycoside hydrolase family 30 beta sandwich domain-containing protein [uncultured Sphingomonas sp.]|uniref:glycoside hydrolase family 30 beta sandwich domain-containing protein n=1 Tax=uncultured Sphingomonas sp. TaxID=158754 RepID=UPI00263379A4|nr:glycoside hydrolase family 30 beta sandwich domain-containing protein [uncultured Sphingomonas sp.]
MVNTVLAPAPQAAATSSFTPTPAALRTSLDETVQMGAVAMTPFAAIQALPGTAIYVDPTETYQQMFGAGAALTESTCYVLANFCTPAQRKALLTMAFGTDGFSTCRIQMGTSDFTWRGTSGYYTYSDADDGTDATLPNFTIAKDMEYIIPVLREALAINPRLKFIFCPWSPPAFLKTINSLLGSVNGVLNTFNGTPANYAIYATYFVKALTAYRAAGIPVWAVTMQNEGNYGPSTYPGCVWTGVQMAAFADILGPALAGAGFGHVKILTGDMNWSNATGYTGASGDLVTNVWADATAAGYVTGAGYHGYSTAGAHEFELSRAKNNLNKEIHFTEMCSVGSLSNKQILQQHLANAIIGSIRCGANSVTFWNLFLEPLSNGLYQPFAPAYAIVAPCATVSTDGNATVVKRPEYMALAHLTNVMRPGARRCKSTSFGVGESDLVVQNVAFTNPDGTTGILLFNNATTAQSVSIVEGPSGFVSFLTLAAGDIVSVNYAAPKSVAATGTLTAPGPVTGLTATSANGVNTLSWTAPSAPDASGLGGYQVRRSTTSGAEVITNGAALAGDTSFVDLDTVVGTTYFYQVFPLSAGGFATTSPETSVLTAASKPGAPTITVASGNAQNIISLSKSPNTNGAAISGYNIFRSTTAGGEGTTPYASNQSLPYTDTAAANGTAYYYTAAAINSVGAGAQSAEVSATPGASPVHYMSVSGSNSNAYANGSTANRGTDSFIDATVWSALTAYQGATSGKNMPLVHTWSSGTAGASNASWNFCMGPTNLPTLLFFTAAGVYGSAVGSAALSTVFTPGAANGIYLRAALNLGTTAVTSAIMVGGSTVNGANSGGTAFSVPAGSAAFFYSTDGITWTQLGSTVTGLPTTGLNQKGGAPVVGHNGNSDTPPTGKFFKAIVRNSTAILWNPDFTIQASAIASFADTAPTPNTWNINNSTEV